ncbi:hypothetical protein BHE74_00009557 [Ensete ventricosum]|nr:hypothetical protein BHE74_00009557 [Ensete ventricosum]
MKSKKNSRRIPPPIASPTPSPSPCLGPLSAPRDGRSPVSLSIWQPSRPEKVVPLGDTGGIIGPDLSDLTADGGGGRRSNGFADARGKRERSRADDGKIKGPARILMHNGRGRGRRSNGFVDTRGKRSLMC